jgi:hypothetical protein
MKELADSLAVRINMQIAISSLPVVEEWMDTTLSRWLESVPTPIDMPADGALRLEVGLASDASRMRWSA